MSYLTTAPAEENNHSNDSTPGRKPEVPTSTTEDDRKISSRSSQSTIFELIGKPHSFQTGLPIGTDLERSYARQAADKLGDYLLHHATGTLEQALDDAGLLPPPGVRLYVVHPLAVKWAQRDGMAVQTGGATHGIAPQANRGLVRVYRRPR
jgi:hypothetical protein